jgi:hypothetical protein
MARRKKELRNSALIKSIDSSPSTTLVLYAFNSKDIMLSMEEVL